MDGERFLVRSDTQTRPMRVDQLDLNQTVLSTLFHLVPSTITLVSDRDFVVQTADANGEFRSWTMSRDEVWCCKGTAMYSGKGKSPASFTAACTYPGKRKSSAAALVGPSNSASLVEPAGKRSRTTCAYGLLTIEVCGVEQTRAGKPKIRPSSAFKFRCARNETETLETLSRRVADEAFRGQDVVLLDTKNLRHMDTPSTRCRFCDLVFS